MTPGPTAFTEHDHAHCCAGVIGRAETLERTGGLRLTPVRRRTLEILAEAHQAMGAYDVLERLKADGFGGQPPVAYRALDYLVERGLVHRIRRLNAFAACTAPGRAHAPAFLICEQCGAVAELAGTETAGALRAEAEAAGFDLDRMSIEATGLCPCCQESTDGAD